MIFNFRLFIKECVIFAATLAVGILSAERLAVSAFTGTAFETFAFSLWDIIALAVAILVFVLALKYRKIGSFLFQGILVFIILGGAQVVAGVFLNAPWDFLAAVILLAAFLIVRNVLMHNAGVLLGIAGLGAAVGVGIHPQTAIWLLVILSVYDILAVYKTKHMVRMAKAMLESGAIFGFIIPFEWKGFFYGKKEAQARAGEKFMILGSGDSVVPLFLAASLVKISLGQAILVGLFAVGGLFVTHLIFINQKERKPMAALPPIATFAIIGYLLAAFLNL